MKKKHSLRFQTTVVLLGFDILILGLIYFFQSYFLDDFYYRNKIEEMIHISDNIASKISEEDIGSLAAEASYLNEVCIRIDTENSSITGTNGNNVCALNNLTSSQVKAIAQETIDHGGKHLFQDYRMAYPFNDRDLFIYGQIVNYYNYPLLVMVSSTVEPLNTTIVTMQSQYLLIAVVVIAVTLLLSFFISRIIIKPLNRFNEEAKKLPHGQYNGDAAKTTSLELDSLNNTLAKANAEINKADVARKELLANVSHDLRTPLTMIVGYGEMIRDIKEENTSDNINVIVNEAKRLSSLVDDLLDVSHLESNQLVLHRQKVDLNDFLRGIYEQYAKYCEILNIEFILETADDGIVDIDVKRISQVLYNFLNNAINYNTSDHKIIKLSVEDNDDHYRISVFDNGQGIKEEDLTKIWDRYYKVDKEHVRFHLGSGIGLSLAKKLLELHQFNYGVDSKYGEYSVFYFDIPKAR